MNERTDKTTGPAWLDIDKFVPPALRAEIGMLIDELAKVQGAVDALRPRVCAALAAANTLARTRNAELIDGIGADKLSPFVSDGFSEVFWILTRTCELDSAWQDLGQGWESVGEPVSMEAHDG